MQSIYRVSARYASFVVIALLSFTFNGCMDHTQPPPTDPPTGDFSDDIKQNISQDNLNKIRELGVNICEGKNVPNLEGIFYDSPNILQKTTVPNDFSPGTRFVDYRFRFKNQDATKLTAEVDFKGINYNNGQVVDEANGKTAFLSGNGNCFTLFVIVEGTFPQNGTRYRTLDVYSGEKTAQGVSNFQNALLMLNDYGDPNNDLIPVNSGRAFKDNDGFSESQNTFRKAVPSVNEEAHPKAYFKD